MDEYIGIVKLFAGNFAPKGWMFCDGSLLRISNNSALFSILGTTYGGNGVDTFALPNLKGRMAIGAGNVNANEYYPLGVAAGTTQNTIMAQNLPSIGSGFQLKVANVNATASTPTATSSIAKTGTQIGRDFNAVPGFAAVDPDTALNARSISYIGQNLPMNNMPPYLGLNYIICIEGIYPSRS
ncbi:phage tail protein [Chryseobacterium vrystaatense]|uniref:Microcystin-dependent protein n=1 Tax=Chryseobacterium vrystaatense TaxID=307480 RepID=A0A1M4WUB7_9FLAO|nr:tail fiber protein [Chryseobacterium vrystaatense]KFF27686.1 tail protein [Chryseobacterium vrystaatense]SHE84824.1 Microcystin-dependent protein [Chryseobacterium vrystaatense]